MTNWNKYSLRMKDYYEDFSKREISPESVVEPRRHVEGVPLGRV